MCRYAERNPLRAALVSRAEQWRYPSLWQWHNGRAVMSLEFCRDNRNLSPEVQHLSPVATTTKNYVAKNAPADSCDKLLEARLLVEKRRLVALEVRR